MRRFRLPILLLCCLGGLILVQPVAAQAIVDPPCTILDLRYPTYLVSGRTPIPISVEVLGAKEVIGADWATRVKYVWTVSGGIIIKGQGTPSILVSALPAPDRLVLRLPINLKLEGGHPACETEKSFSISTDAECSPPDKFDEYGDLSLPEEKSRLDSIAAKLTASGPASKLFIVAYSRRAYCL
jgi:hypothetical protein